MSVVSVLIGWIIWQAYMVGDLDPPKPKQKDFSRKDGEAARRP